MKKIFFFVWILFILLLTWCSSRTNLSSSSWGINIPDTYNHTEGKNRILYSIRSTSFGQWDWAWANWLLWSSLLDVESIDREWYKFLFISLLTDAKWKLDASRKNYSTWLNNIEDKERETMSIITRRESVFYSLANQLEYRYIYNDYGNYDRNYKPQKRESNKKLHQVILKWLDVYNEFSQKWFDDKTLKDSLCIGLASLERDWFEIGSKGYWLGSPQVCLDAVTYTADYLDRNKNDGFINYIYDFVSLLSEQMYKRDLATDDEILLPNFQWTSEEQKIIQNMNEKELESKMREIVAKKQEPILKIISDDLDKIKK
jgi:hypothetical protein